MKWLIKTPAPDDKSRFNWGDTYFGWSLARALRALGQEVQVNFRGSWYGGAQSDVVLVLRGLHRYDREGVNQNALHILWTISHPKDVPGEEYLDYDVICVGSRTHAEQLSSLVPGKLHVLYQCTDTEVFYPPLRPLNAAHRKGTLFVGNTRGQVRASVMEISRAGVPLEIYGANWPAQGLGERVVREKIVNSELGALYRGARMTLNDHWADMNELGYVNNRVFDALACGLPVLSDAHPEIEAVFGHAVGIVQAAPGTFAQAWSDAMLRYPELLEQAAQAACMVCRDHSFLARARQLAEVVKSQ